MEEQQPTKFGRYQVKGVIGKGAMGVIYLAEDPVIGRQVAIKVIQLNPGLSTAEIEGLKTRFEREFRSAGTLSHPNIVTVHDVGTEGSTPYIAMEYVEGKTLEHVINEQRVLSFEEISDLLAQICDALDFAHEHGVVHRDVKPANILLDRVSRPKITDFGVAKLTESGMTHTGTMVGTPWYMSPEQVVGEAVTGAADQFSVAVMTYQLLTRERPFTGERSSTVLYKIVHEEPVRPHLLNPKLMDQLDDVLMRAFQKNPEQRYPTCREFATELRAALGVAAARTAAKTLAGSAPPPTEWPTASMTLDAGMMKEWQSAARSAAQSGATSPSQSGAGSGARSGAQSAAKSAARSAAQSGATSAATSAARQAAMPGPAADTDATPMPDAPAAAPAAVKPKAPPKPKTPGSGRGGLYLGIGAAVLALAAGLGFWAMSGVNNAPQGVEDEAGTAAIDESSMQPQPLPPDLAAESASAAAAQPAGATDAAAVPQSAMYKVVTKPAGAGILLEGKMLDVVTPTELELPGDARQLIQLELEGFKTVRWTFDAARLSPEQARTHTLYFPLVKSETVAAAAPPPPSTAAVASSPLTQPPNALPPAPTSPRGTLDRSLKTVRGGKEVPQPVKIVDAAPRYARESVPSGRQPVVILELTLDPAGEVANAKVLGGGLTPELDEAARQAAYQWRYRVNEFKGKPVNTVVSSTVVFEAP